MTTEPWSGGQLTGQERIKSGQVADYKATLSNATAARPKSQESGHWYDSWGMPRYEMPRSDGQGFRPTTLADARKLNLLPSVTHLLKVLHKQGLVDWLVEQSCLAVLTAPRTAEESLDSFVYRVLHQEKQQDQERDIAAGRGTDIHTGMQALSDGQLGLVPDGISAWIMPAFDSLKQVTGDWLSHITETVVVGSGYAGRVDLIAETADTTWIWDFKSTKRLPDKPWPEHRLQLAAYAAAHWVPGIKPIRTANCYISTTQCGKCVLLENQGKWQDTFTKGFMPILTYWQWSNNYTPKQ